MNKKHMMVAAFVITIGVITWADIKECHELPWPPRYVATGIVFGILDLFSVINEDLAGVMAIGIVLAALVNKGFTANCQHAEATVQPTAYKTLDNGQQPQTLA